MQLRNLVAVAVCSIFAPGWAHADDAAVAARRHFESGTALYDVGRFDEAAREYDAAYQLRNDPALLYNLGQAYRLAGNQAKAIVTYRAFLRRVPNSPDRAEVEQRIVELQRQLDEQKAASRPAPTPQPTPQAETPAASNPALVAAAPPRHVPVYKKWWLWTTLGVVVAGGAVGLGLGLTAHSNSAPVFPAVGTP